MLNMKFTKVIKADQFTKEIILSNIAREVFQIANNEIVKGITEHNLELNKDNLNFILEDIKLMFDDSEHYK